MATITTRLTPADHGRAMTLAEFLDAEVEEGYRFELARGVVEMTNVANPSHRLVVSYLYDVISVYRREHPGAIFDYGGGAEFQLAIPQMESSRHPDLGVVLGDTPADRRGYRPPSLVAEVISPRSRERDLVSKREEYLVCGLQEYWIVDITHRQVLVLARAGDAWVEQVCRGDEPIASRVLPGLAATVADLWINLERTVPVEDQ